MVTLGLLWFVAVILAYYAVNKPLSTPQINAILDLALVALGWLSTFSLANLVGWTVIRRISRLERGERFVLQVGVGLGIIALAMLVLGLVVLIAALLPQPTAISRRAREPASSAKTCSIA